MNNKKIVLAIMDGIGLRNEKFGNAVKLANPKFLNYAMKKFPNTQLHASGEYVGLPYGQIGNSEVGHQNIGAGRTVLQELLTINESINNGKFFKNKVLLDLIQSAKDKKKSFFIPTNFIFQIWSLPATKISYSSFKMDATSSDLYPSILIDNIPKVFIYRW